MNTEKYKLAVVVKLEIDGTHNWPNCYIEDVGYLRNEHRHIFHITAKKYVNDSDREIEIISLKHQIEKFVRQNEITKSGSVRFKNKSCEMIAEEILKEFQCYEVQVLEDNENGGICYEIMDR